MIRISLLDFLRTGTLGPVCLGQTRTEVETLLGPPDAESLASPSSQQSQIWKYGDMECHWVEPDGTLYMIFFDHFDIPTGGPAITLDPWVIRGGQTNVGLTVAEVATAFEAAKVPFREIDHVLASYRTLQTAAGVQLQFVDEQDWKGLSSIFLSRPIQSSQLSK